MEKKYDIEKWAAAGDMSIKLLDNDFVFGVNGERTRWEREKKSEGKANMLRIGDNMKRSEQQEV